MTMNNALDNGQAHAGALKFLDAVKALEDAEQFVGVLHVETDAVVANVINGFRSLFLESNFYARLFLMPREFEGVRQQIQKDLAQQYGVSRSGGQSRLDDDFRFFLRVIVRQFFNHGVDQLEHIDSLPGEILAPDPRKIKKIIDYQVVDW